MSENSPLLSASGDGFDETDDTCTVNSTISSPPTQKHNGIDKAAAVAATAATAPAPVEVKKSVDAATSRFADYFVICGLDLDTGLEPDRFAGESGGHVGSKPLTYL